METKEIIERLLNMSEITIDADFRNILIEAAKRLEELDKRRMTVTVTFTSQQVSDMISEAFRNVTGKDFEYVVDAVKEKMEREGEFDGEEADNTEFQQTENVSCEDKNSHDDRS